MPKPKSDKKTGKGTPKKGRGRRLAASGFSDDESIGGDTASILSMNSDRGSFEDGENGNTGDGDEQIYSQSRDAMEEKYAEAIDGLTEKSANVRAASLASLISLLSSQFIPEIVLGRRETLRDQLEKIFKRGSRSEQAQAASLFSLTILQLGSIDGDLIYEDFNAVKPCLQSIVLDHTVPVATRVKCCDALCFGAFLAETCLQDVAAIIHMIEPLFGVQAKKSGVSNGHTSDTEDDVTKIPKSSCGTLASAAISGWALLLTVMGSEFLDRRVHLWVRSLQGLLEQAELEIRLSAGEALAVLVEICGLADDDEFTDSDEEETHTNGTTNGITNGHSVNGNGHTELDWSDEPRKPNMRALISKLKELSVESHKYRAKKDRRQQRHNFRDYLHAVQDGETPGQTMKFGHGEVLEIDSWAKKRQYDAICQLLASGINRHLIDNILVRQVLELGAPKAPVMDNGLGAKAAKHERQYMNAMNFKARCVSRGKNRDLRMAAVADY